MGTARTQTEVETKLEPGATQHLVECCVLCGSNTSAAPFSISAGELAAGLAYLALSSFQRAESNGQRASSEA